MTSIRRALAFSFLEKYALIGLSLVSYVLIARILTPEEIGIYSVAAALIGIAQVMREFGIGSYLIQEKELDESRIRTAFGVSLVLGLTMFLVFTLGASLLGRFYGDERVVDIVRIVALNFLVLPFCSISISLLRREMKFDRLMRVNLGAALVGLVVTLGFAFAGYGPQCLAWGTIACNIATGLSAWLLQDNRRLLRPSLTGWRRLVSFGGQSTLAGIVTSVAMDINDLVVAKVMGFAPVAMLSRALGLMNLFHRDLLGAARNVAYPAFAKAHREGQPVEPLYIASLSSITAFGWPFYGFIALYPLEILRLMAGPQWDAAASLVPVFAAAGALLSTVILTTTLILAVGRVDLSSGADIVVHLLRVILVVAAAFIFKTLIACALAFLASVAISVPIYFAFKSRCVPNDLRGLLTAFLKSLQMTLGTLLLAAAVSFYTGFHRSVPMPLGEFLPVCLATAIAWLVAVRVLRHPIGSDPLFKRLTSRLPFMSRPDR